MQLDVAQLGEEPEREPQQEQEQRGRHPQSRCQHRAGENRGAERHGDLEAVHGQPSVLVIGGAGAVAQRQVEATVPAATHAVPSWAKEMRSCSGHVPEAPQMEAAVHVRAVTTGASPDTSTDTSTSSIEW